MNDTITTIVGNVVDTPSRRVLDSGVCVASFRVASTARRFDRVTNRWADGESLFLKVTCWRGLAENTIASVVKGDPVVVTGRLFTRTYEVAESRRASYELEATAIGLDLNRGRATFKRVSTARAVTVDELGPDGLPTGSAVEAHLETGIAASGSSTSETDPPDDGALDEADADAALGAFDELSPNPPTHLSSQDPDEAEAQPDAERGPAGPTAGRSGSTSGAAPAGGADVGAGSGEAPGAGEAVGAAGAVDASAPGIGTGRRESDVPAASRASGTSTPRPPTRRRGSSPVPA